LASTGALSGRGRRLDATRHSGRKRRVAGDPAAEAGEKASCPECGTVVMQHSMIPILRDGVQGYVCVPCARKLVVVGADPGRALAFVTSAFGSYSSCRQYIEDIERARDLVGGRAPVIEKLRLFYNHPLFIDVVATRTATALQKAPAARVLFTAHSIPVGMAAA